jgi:protein transport protein SEC31
MRTGEVVYEFPTGSQWSFDVQWCPRNPAVVSSCSFDGRVSVYSLMGSALPAQTSSKVAEAFTLDSFSQPLPQHTADVNAANQTMLKKPPKWLRRPVGASFAFGGKLVSFESIKSASGQQHSPALPAVTISQVVTETELVARSLQLEQTLVTGRYTEFCDSKIASSKDEMEATIWSFLKVNFEADSRQHYLNLLGYSQSTVRNKVNEAMRQKQRSPSVENRLSSERMPLQDETTDGISSVSTPFDTIETSGLESTELTIRCTDDCDGLVTQALLTANFEAAVDVCLANGRWAEAIILAIAGGADLLAVTEKRFFEANKSSLNQLIWAVITQKFETIVQSCDLQNWKEALAVVLTYAGGEEFTKLCDLLGKRLETEGDAELASNAHLCYIVSGNTEELVASWNKIIPDTSSHQTLQDLVEKVMILWKGVESVQSLQNISQGHFARRLHHYARELASQGCIATAVNYLSPVSPDDMSVAILKDRLNQCLGHVSGVGMKPYRTVEVLPYVPKQLAAEPVRQVLGTERQRTTSGASYVSGGAERQRTTSATYMQNPVDGLTQQLQYNAHIAPDSSYSSSSQPPNVAPYANPSRMQPGAVAAPSTLAKAGPLTKYNVLQPTNCYSDQVGPNLQQQQQPQYISNVTGGGYNSPGAPTSVPNSLLYNTSGAWNDPPVVKDTPRLSEAPGAPRYDGKLLNPADYQPAPPQPQPHQLQKDHFKDQLAASEPTSAAGGAALCQQSTGSVPVEHQILQDVFNQLVQLCAGRASHNPQIKKKLEDVSRKLEALYSRLCVGALSVSTVAGLHQIVQAIQHYDYQTALAYHAQIVGAGSFTEISPFMPGIKVLMQTAMQLQVYIQ